MVEKQWNAQAQILQIVEMRLSRYPLAAYFGTSVN